MSSQAERIEETLAPGTRFGRYEIIRCIGAGGMGAVYEANHVGLGKRVALKLLHASLVSNDSMRMRFVREGEAIARIRHPNVVDVLDVGVEDRSPFLVMEYLEGDSLLAYLDKHGAMDERTTANLIVPIVSGLAAAHESGVIHRDLKPDNILLAREGKNIVPKIVDFGISKVTTTNPSELALTQQVVLGTPYYMAPEQAQQSGPLDARVDQYALGVMLYECSTHELPFNGTTLFELMTKIVNGAFKKPTELRPEMDPKFEAIVLRAMSRDADDRYPSLEALGRDLLEFAGNRVRSQHGPSFGLSPETFPPPSMSSGESPMVEGRVSGAKLKSGEALVVTPVASAPDAMRASESGHHEVGAAAAQQERNKAPVAMVALLVALLGLGALGVWFFSLRADEPAAAQTEPAPEPVMDSPPETPPATPPVIEGPAPTSAVADPAPPTPSGPVAAPAAELVAAPVGTTQPRRQRNRGAPVTMEAAAPTPPPDLDIRLER